MRSRLLILGFVTMLCCSCSRLPKLVIFNNTGVAVQVVTDKSRCDIPNGKAGEIWYPIENTMTITHPNGVWTYVVDRYPPPAYCEPTAQSNIHAQIESNGYIYVFLPTAPFPVRDLKPQPGGFPLVPSSTHI